MYVPKQYTQQIHTRGPYFGVIWMKLLRGEIDLRDLLYRFPGVWDLSLFILLPFSSFFFLLSSSRHE